MFDIICSIYRITHHNTYFITPHMLSNWLIVTRWTMDAMVDGHHTHTARSNGWVAWRRNETIPMLAESKRVDWISRSCWRKSTGQLFWNEMSINRQLGSQNTDQWLQFLMPTISSSTDPESVIRPGMSVILLD
ncbi:hypothetical protein AHF37_03467 [Paragonimus kellicotti]|nr:hypothetical protein AHF37_03467 [Paragonimus kellicotti]